VNELEAAVLGKQLFQGGLDQWVFVRQADPDRFGNSLLH
jgi:hypothetical protein